MKSRYISALTAVIAVGAVILNPVLFATGGQAVTVTPTVTATAVYSTQDAASDVAAARAELNDVITHQREVISQEIPAEYRTPAVDEAAVTAESAFVAAEEVSELEGRTLLTDGLNLRFDEVEALLSSFSEKESQVFAAVESFNSVKAAERTRVEDEAAAAQREAEEAAAAAALESSQAAMDVGVSQAVTVAAATVNQSFEYTVYPSASGIDQSLVDACNGPVWWTGNLLAEHWHCGGASFPKTPGSIVNVSGSGTYQVVGIVGVVNGYTATTADVPGGYDLIYQTCLNDNPGTTGFVGLVRIG